MATVTMREIKQNPHAVIDQILASGEASEITFHGEPTGVVIAPALTQRKRWLTGSELRTLTPISPEGRAEWRRQIEELRDSEPLTDPWGER